MKYDVRIDGRYDLVFVDGPSLSIDGAKRKDAVNSNVFDLECMPRVIVVDVRRATAECLSDRYAKDYDVRLSDLFSGKTLRPGYNYFSVFVAHSVDSSKLKRDPSCSRTWSAKTIVDDPLPNSRIPLELRRIHGLGYEHRSSGWDRGG